MRRTFLLGAVSLAMLWGQDYVPAGAQIDVRANESIRIFADDAKGQVYGGVVANEIASQDGRILIPRGAKAELIVRHVDKDEIAINLALITVGEHRYAVDTREHTARQREGIGAGGGKGAVIGSLAGGAAGAGGQLATRGKGVNVPADSLLSFRLEQPVKIDVRNRTR